jgi:hypothetical protein
MKFVCMIKSPKNITTEYCSLNYEKKDRWLEAKLGVMDFWDGGNLYVFINPETRIACAFIQNT